MTVKRNTEKICDLSNLIRISKEKLYIILEEARNSWCKLLETWAVEAPWVASEVSAQSSVQPFEASEALLQREEPMFSQGLAESEEATQDRLICAACIVPFLQHAYSENSRLSEDVCTDWEAFVRLQIKFVTNVTIHALVSVYMMVALIPCFKPFVLQVSSLSVNQVPYLCFIRFQRDFKTSFQSGFLQGFCRQW